MHNAGSRCKAAGRKKFSTERNEWKLTWFPKTPMLHALLTWSGPNQTAARRAGTDRMNVWLRATNDWPRKVIQKRSGLTLNTFIQDPNVVPIAPAKAANLSPWNRNESTIIKKKFRRILFLKTKFHSRKLWRPHLATEIVDHYLWEW